MALHHIRVATQKVAAVYHAPDFTEPGVSGLNNQSSVRLFAAHVEADNSVSWTDPLPVPFSQPATFQILAMEDSDPDGYLVTAQATRGSTFNISSPYQDAARVDHASNALTLTQLSRFSANAKPDLSRYYSIAASTIYVWDVPFSDTYGAIYVIESFDTYATVATFSIHLYRKDGGAFTYDLSTLTQADFGSYLHPGGTILNGAPATTLSPTTQAALTYSAPYGSPPRVDLGWNVVTLTGETLGVGSHQIFKTNGSIFLDFGPGDQEILGPRVDNILTIDPGSFVLDYVRINPVEVLPRAHFFSVAGTTVTAQGLTFMDSNNQRIRSIVDGTRLTAYDEHGLWVYTYTVGSGLTARFGPTQVPSTDVDHVTFLGSKPGQTPDVVVGESNPGVGALTPTASAFFHNQAFPTADADYWFTGSAAVTGVDPGRVVDSNIKIKTKVITQPTIKANATSTRLPPPE